MFSAAQRFALCPFGVLVGGTRERHFDGTNFKPRKLPQNAQTPTTMAPAFVAGVRVHAVLGCFTEDANTPRNSYLSLANQNRSRTLLS